jgi:hypothetical protein
VTRKCKDCKWYVDQPRTKVCKLLGLGSCVVPTPKWVFAEAELVCADEDADDCKCFEPKEGEGNE